MMHFHGLLHSTLPAEVKLVKLKLEETPTSYAEWQVEDGE
jgi:hypothetical protein